MIRLARRVFLANLLGAPAMQQTSREASILGRLDGRQVQGRPSNGTWVATCKATCFGQSIFQSCQQHARLFCLAKAAPKQRGGPFCCRCCCSSFLFTFQLRGRRNNSGKGRRTTANCNRKRNKFASTHRQAGRQTNKRTNKQSLLFCKAQQAHNNVISGAQMIGAKVTWLDGGGGCRLAGVWLVWRPEMELH